MERLSPAIRTLIQDLELLMDAVDMLQAPLKSGHRLTITMQIHSLKLARAELRQQVTSRRVWSLSEATLPVLASMLRAAKRDRVGLPPEVVERAEASAMHLGEELRRFAEGRSG